MALIKHRPKIQLRCPSEVRPGESFTATVVIDARRAVLINHVTVELWGMEAGATGAGQYTVRRQWEVCRLQAMLTVVQTTFGPGKSEHECRFHIPSGAPPSYRGSRASCEYFVQVRAAIPWWPDAKRTFEINVGMEDHKPAFDGQAVVFSSRPEGPNAREPHVECSLANNAVAQGGVVSGAIALSNVAHNRYDGATLVMRAVEIIHLPGQRNSSNELRRYETRVAIDVLEEGKSYAFRFRLPPSPPPTFAARLWSVRWQIEVRAKIRWASDLRMATPLTVLPGRFREPASPKRLAPPDVGSERLQRIWAAVAQETPLALDGASLRGTIGDVAVVISRDHRGRKGIHLVATLGYPSLGLELQIQPYAMFSWSSGFKLGSAGFDKAHRVTCREETQGASLLEPMVPDLAAFREVEMSDTAARLDARGSGASKARLGAFVTATLLVARGIHEGRSRIVPPASMMDTVPVWQALAHELNGELAVADMRVTGVVLGMTATVRTLFGENGVPFGTSILLELQHSVDERHRVTVVTGATEPLDLLPNDAARLARRLMREALQLGIRADQIELMLVPAAGDARDLTARARGVGELAGLLTGTAGPYR